MKDQPSTPSLASIEAEIDARMFDERPLHIIQRYLDSFASDGTMVTPVPIHVLEAMAKRLQAFMAHDTTLKTLDEAFGGSVGRQRQAARSADKQYQVAFDVIAERREAKNLGRAERGGSTPFEIACETVASEHCMSEENVRALYKASGKRSKKKSG